MVHLITFGGLSVTIGGAPAGGAGHQRKTLALLALLAVAGRRGVSRDKLIAYLWPDADTERARGLLKQACYALRRDLHTHDLLLGATELRLNPAVVTSDVELFQTALEQGDSLRAVSNYKGPFLDGFFLSDSPEFEEWVETERTRLRRQACEALESLATGAVAQGEHRAALEHWRRLCSLDPPNSRLTLGLMQALVATGDPAGAIELARAHQTFLHEEFDLGPDPTIAELARRIRILSAEPAALPQRPAENPSPPKIEVKEAEAPPVSRPSAIPMAPRLVLGGVVALLIAAALLTSSSQRTHVLTLNVLGPDGKRSICGYLPKSTVVPARLLRTTHPIQGTFDAFACPESQLRLRSPPGRWYLRVTLPSTPNLGPLPWKELVPVVVRHDVTQDVVIHGGSPLAGRATFQGAPVAGVRLTVGHDSLGVMNTYGRSGSDGSWVEFLGRSPVILQPGIRYTFSSTCMFLGAKLVNRLPPGGVRFPSELSSVDCNLVDGSTRRFTHDHTRLVVTAMPGDIGGTSSDFLHELGFGWGVQFPIASGQAPARTHWNSHIWQAGLMIGVAPDRVLSGVGLQSQRTCGTRCRDLGLDGNVQVKPLPRLGKEVVWQYSDATSDEGSGLRVEQHSFDGQLPADYVLFRFVITNGGGATVAFHAGIFADWDIAVDESDDVGFTGMNGKLMYQANSIDGTPTGPYLGTLMVSSAPATSNFFFRKEMLLEPKEQVDALAGRLVQPRTDAAGDNRYIQGAGPFRLGREENAELWVAVVAGETRDQLFATAQAAARDIAVRRSGGCQSDSRTVRRSVGKSGREPAQLCLPASR